MGGRLTNPDDLDSYSITPNVLKLPDDTFCSFTKANTVVHGADTKESPFNRKPIIKGIEPDEYDPELIEIGRHYSEFFKRMDEEEVLIDPLGEVDEEEGEDIERIYFNHPIFLRTNKGVYETPTSILLDELQLEASRGTLPSEELDDILYRVLVEHGSLEIKEEQEKRYSTDLLASMYDYNEEWQRVMDYIEANEDDLMNNIKKQYRPVTDESYLFGLEKKLASEGELEFMTYEGNDLQRKLRIYVGTEEPYFDLTTHLLVINRGTVDIEDSDGTISRYKGNFRIKAHQDGGELTIREKKASKVERGIIAQRLFYLP